jgi:hypothetical protein
VGYIDEGSNKNGWAIQNDHPAKMTPLKTILVDDEIAPLVNWLNSLLGVFTLWSCQGDDAKEGEPYSLPYVVFICMYDEAYDQISEVVYKAATTLRGTESIRFETIVEFSQGKANTSYHLSTECKTALKKLIAALPEAE